MKKIDLDIAILNIRQHEYLKEMFEGYSDDNFDAFYDYLSGLDDYLVNIVNYRNPNEFSLVIFDILNDVYDDFGSIEVNFTDLY